MRQWFVARISAFVLGIAFLINAPAGAVGLDSAFDRALLGPERAAGVVIWNHGRSMNVEDSESPSPPYLRALRDSGWDVLRFNRLREVLLQEMTLEVQISVRGNLLEFEAGLRAEREPLQALRCELMDSVDRRLLNMEILELPPEVRKKLRAQSSEMLQTDAEARTYIAANEVRMGVLREYASLRFGDRTPGDWFDVYEKASRLRQRGIYSG